VQYNAFKNMALHVTTLHGTPSIFVRKVLVHTDWTRLGEAGNARER